MELSDVIKLDGNDIVIEDVLCISTNADKGKFSFISGYVDLPLNDPLADQSEIEDEPTNRSPVYIDYKDITLDSDLPIPGKEYNIILKKHDEDDDQDYVVSRLDYEPVSDTWQFKLKNLERGKFVVTPFPVIDDIDFDCNYSIKLVEV